MQLDNKRVAILVEDLFDERELLYPYYRLQEAGAEVRIVGSGRSPEFRGKAGLNQAADCSIDEVKPEEFDGLVIPGGYAPDRMRRFPAMVALVRELVATGRPVAAICHAGWMLSSANVLAGRMVTSFPAIKDDLIHAGAGWVDEPVVVDGNLVTAQQPQDLPAFMRAFLGLLGGGSSDSPPKKRRRSRRG